jgi:hypothetical protein
MPSACALVNCVRIVHRRRHNNAVRDQCLHSGGDHARVILRDLTGKHAWDCRIAPFPSAELARRRPSADAIAPDAMSNQVCE